MEDREVKVFELAVVVDGKGLYIDSSSPSDRALASRIMNQFDIPVVTYDKVQKFYKTMDKALEKLLRQ